MSIRKCRLQFLAQFRILLWIIQEVECCNRQSVRSGISTGANDYLCFLPQSLNRFLFRRKTAIQQTMEDRAWQAFLMLVKFLLLIIDDFLDVTAQAL